MLYEHKLFLDALEYGYRKILRRYQADTVTLGDFVARHNANSDNKHIDIVSIFSHLSGQLKDDVSYRSSFRYMGQSDMSRVTPSLDNHVLVASDSYRPNIFTFDMPGFLSHYVADTLASAGILRDFVMPFDVNPGTYLYLSYLEEIPEFDEEDYESTYPIFAQGTELYNQMKDKSVVHRVNWLMSMDRKTELYRSQKARLQQEVRVKTLEEELSNLKAKQAEVDADLIERLQNELVAQRELTWS